MSKLRLGLLGSTRGSHLPGIVQALEEQGIPAEIKVVISNKPDALILQKAREHGLPAVYADPTGLSRESYDNQLTSILQQHAVEWILLLGYMRILSADFIQVWPDRVLNIHPSLLPDFAGGMDLEVHRQVLAARRKESGCTIHYVTEELDAGPILIQKVCPVFPGDDEITLKQRVQELESQAWIDALHCLTRAG